MNDYDLAKLASMLREFGDNMNKRFDRSESIMKGFKIESVIEKETTINTYIDDFISELEISCTSNNYDIGDSLVEWDDEIIFDYDNIVPQEETISSIVNYPNSYDIVPLVDNAIVTMQPRVVESVDEDQTDSEMELSMANTFEVQELPSNPTKIGEKNSLAVCAEKQVHAVLEAVSKESFKDTGDAIRRVWDPGVNYGDGGEILPT